MGSRLGEGRCCLFKEEEKWGLHRIMLEKEHRLYVELDDGDVR